ncbi:hypothetical protein [Pseudorhodoplanes sp.]|uniref:hypothetical protein n=1 Tax=Pseudorhodoplanes sp. TaxID=1934341 RepID=UPI003919BBF3
MTVPQRLPVRAPDFSRLTVLAMVPAPDEERGQYLIRLLSALKDRWQWKVSVLCSAADVPGLKPLTEPDGLCFVPPNYRVAPDWEGDPASLADCQARLHEAELVTGVPVGQLLLAAQANIGCAFTLPHLRPKPNTTSEKMLADNNEPHRAYLRLFGFADDMLEKVQPDLVVAYEWEKPWRSSVWMAAARRKIKCIAIRRSKLNGDHYYWTVDRMLANMAASALAKVKVDTGAQVSDAARRHIATFRDTPKTVKYIGDKWDIYSKRTWITWHKGWAISVAKRAWRRSSGRGRANDLGFGKLLEYNRTILEGRRDRKFIASFEEPELAGMRYVYFPMHKEADLPLVLQAPRWHDQANTIRVLAASLPSGYRLLAREHRFNIGMRPKHYYEWLSRLPNVTLVDPFDDQFKYIRNAGLLVTENGSSGWEGLLLKRPVITLSRTAYDGACLARKVPDADALGAVVLEALSKPVLADPEYDRRLGCMIDAEFETTFSMDIARVMEGVERLEVMLSELSSGEGRAAL